MRYLLAFFAALLFACGARPPTPEKEQPQEMIETPLAVAPTGFSYPTTTFFYLRNQAIAPNTPTIEGTGPFLFEPDRLLPLGMSIDAATGVISGTPTRYVINARNDAGRAKVAMVISVADMPEISFATTSPKIIAPGTPFHLPMTTPDNASYDIELTYEGQNPNEAFWIGDGFSGNAQQLLTPQEDFTARVTAKAQVGYVTTVDLHFSFVAPSPHGDPKTHTVVVDDDGSHTLPIAAIEVAIGDTIELFNSLDPMLYTALILDNGVSIPFGESFFFGINGEIEPTAMQASALRMDSNVEGVTLAWTVHR
jgi:hypothetical protein